MRTKWNKMRSLLAGATALVLAATLSLGAGFLPASAAGGGLSWSQPQQVLTLQGGTPLIWASNLVVSGGSEYWAYVDSSATPWLATNAGGSWQNYNLGVQGLTHSGATTPLGSIAVQNGVVYIPYLGSDGLLYLDYNPSGSPGGPWIQVNVVPSANGALGGLGTETGNPSAAVAGSNLYVAFQDGAPLNTPGAGQVYLASIGLSSLPQTGGGSASWNIQNVSAAEGNSDAPAITSNGQTVSLAWDTNNGTLNFLGDVSSGQAQTVFTAPNDFYSMTQMAAGGASGSGGNVHVIALYAGGNSAAAYAATDAGGSWSPAQLGPTSGSGVNTSASQDHPAAAVGSWGPAVAYNDNPTSNAYTGDTLYVATFAGGQWNPVAVGSAQNNPLQLPALAATSNGFDLLYVNNDGNSPELYTASTTYGPVVTSVSPNSGPAAGGTQITITGSGFTGATAVIFGGSSAGGNSGFGGPATGFQVVSDTQITATAPPGSGTVDVTVVAPGGTSATGPADRFTYTAGSQGGGGGNAGGTSGNTGGGSSSSGPSFNDLGGYNWAAGAIESLAGEGIIKGTGAGTFDPAGEVTRAQFAALMQRALSLPAPAQPVSFTDVAASEWEYAPVEAVTPFMDYYQLPGGGYAFHPDQAMDRQDVATVIVKIFAAGNKLSVLSASDTQTVLGSVTDASGIAPALRVYVATAIKAGIMAGFPDGSFQPLGSLTRAQIAVLIQRLQNQFLTTGSGTGGGPVPGGVNNGVLNSPTVNNFLGQ